MQLSGNAEGLFSIFSLMVRKIFAVVKWGNSSGRGMAYCPGPLIKTTFPLPASDLEISLAFPVSAARTVARERHWEFLAGITCLYSSPVATGTVGNGQNKGAGEGGKSSSSSQNLFSQVINLSVFITNSTSSQ